MNEVEVRPVSKTVAVVGTRSAARSLAMATLLKDCIDRHGWSERLRVYVGGYNRGAGRGSDAELGMLARDGYEPIATNCADVASDQTMLAACDCVVVACGDDASLFLEWPEADGKQIFSLTDFLDTSAWAIEDEASGFRDFVDEVELAIPSLVRSLIAWPAG